MRKHHAPIRVPLFVAGFILWALGAQAATLEKLSLDDLIQKSTAIVECKVLSSYTGLRGRVVYTYYRISVTSQLKGAGISQADVATPGGVMNGVQQIFPGSPSLAIGQTYVLFLWTSPSHLTQIIGLSQGLFSLSSDAAGELIVKKAASAEAMIDPRTGQSVKDHMIEMPLTRLKAQVTRVLAGVAQ